MPSVVCPYCDSEFEWRTDMGEGRTECPLCGKALRIVRKTGKERAARALPQASTTWGTEGFHSEERREEFGGIKKGDILGGFRVDEMLGAGAMAVVYKATQLSLDRPVALKVLPTEYARKEIFVRQFDSETDLLASLNHPNIVNIIDRGREGDTYYFAMEYVEGTTLGEMVSAGDIGEDFFLEIMEDCAEALSYAHSRGIIHRDIKPANIMLNDQGLAKIADFGIAGLLAEADADSGGRRRVMGTRGYMPPEQEQDVRRTDERSDIFALGAVMYRVLTDRIPSNLPPNPPSELSPEVDPGIDSLVLKCLEKDRSRRYQTADELLEALRAYKRQISRVGEVCPECHKENPVTQKTCLQCGADLSELFDTCPECGSDNRIDVDICRSCGASINSIRHQISVRISKLEEQARSLALHHRYSEAIDRLEEVMQVEGKMFQRARDKAERMMANYRRQRAEYYGERIKYAKRLANEGKLDAALEILRDVPEDLPDHEQAQAFSINVRSRMAVATKRLEEASRLIEERELDQAEKKLESVANAWVNCPGLEEAQRELQNTRETEEMLKYELQEVRQFLEKGEFSQAREALQFALSTMPDNPQVKALHARIEQGQKEAVFANTVLEGKKAFDAGSYRDAVRCWTAARDMLPEGDQRRQVLLEQLRGARGKLAASGIVLLQPAQVVALSLAGPPEEGPIPTRVLLTILLAMLGAIVLVGGVVVVLALSG